MELPSRHAVKQDKILVRVIIRGDVEPERVRSQSHHFSQRMPSDTIVQTAAAASRSHYSPPISVSVPGPTPNPVPVSISDITQLETKTQKRQPVSPRPLSPEKLPIKNTVSLPNQPAPKNTLILPGKPVLQTNASAARVSLPNNRKKEWLSPFNLTILKLLSFGAFTALITAWLTHKQQDNKSSFKSQAAAFHLEKAMSTCIITIQQGTLLSQKYHQLASLLRSADRGHQAFQSPDDRKRAEKELLETGILYNAKLLELRDDINQLQFCFSSYRSTMDQKKSKVLLYKPEADPSSSRVLRYYSYLLRQLQQSNPSMLSAKELEKLEIVQSNLDQLIENDSMKTPIYPAYKEPPLLVPPELITKYNAIN